MSRILARGFRARLLTLILLDAALIASAIAIAAYVRLGSWAWTILRDENGFGKTLVIVAVVQTCLYYTDLYDIHLLSDRRELFIRLIQALASASFLLAAVYFWFPALIIGRGVFIVAALLLVIFVSGWRMAFEWVSGTIGPRERLLLVGTSGAALTLARELFARRHELGVEIAGFVDPDPSKIGISVINPGVVGTVEDIPSIVRSRNVDRVVVSLADARGKLPMEKLLEMKLDGVKFDHLPSVYEEYTGKIAIENLRPSWLIFSSGFEKSRLVATAKRLLDLGAAAVGIVLAAPLMALMSIVIKLSSPGPILYHQQRVGQHGRIFTVHKLRSMHANAEAVTGPVWAKREGDPRVTRIGTFLRRSRIDELPQLWNVLKGDMSLVGPRPERPEFVKDLTRGIPFYGQRHVVRPGLTGWAQVKYTYGASREDALEKLQYDLFYIKHVSVGLDLFIMLLTVKTIVLRKGA